MAKGGFTVPLLLGASGIGLGAIGTAVAFNFFRGGGGGKKPRGGTGKIATLGDSLAEAITGSTAQGRFSRRRSVQAQRSGITLIRTGRTPAKKRRFNIQAQRAVKGTTQAIPGGGGVVGAFLDLFG